MPNPSSRHPPPSAPTPQLTFSPPLLGSSTEVISLSILFKMFDLVVQLTGGGPGSTTELTSINLKREAFEKWRTGYSSAYAIILFVTVFGLASIYVKALNKVKER